MTTVEKQKELHERIIYGLGIAYEKLIQSKRQTNGEIVVIKDNKIVRIKP